MNDFIVQGNPTIKRMTVIEDRVDEQGRRVLVVIQEYRDPVLDNNPTPNNKANLLSDETANRIWGAAQPEVPTVNLALAEFSGLQTSKANSFSTFELIQRGLI